MAPSVAGIAVTPGQNLVLLFAAAQTQGQARVTLTDGPEVVVRAVLGAATFTSGSPVVLTATPDASSDFEAWGGACSQPTLPGWNRWFVLRGC